VSLKPILAKQLKIPINKRIQDDLVVVLAEANNKTALFTGDARGDHLLSVTRKLQDTSAAQQVS
jgi:hypothetical protein